MAKKLTKKKYKKMKARINKIESKIKKQTTKPVDVSFDNFCSSCGVNLKGLVVKHKKNCTKFKHEWEFEFDDGHIEIYWGNTKEQAKRDMVEHYQHLIDDAEQSNLNDSCEMFENVVKMTKSTKAEKVN